jgi:putative ABC transport system permease protein
MTGLARLVRRAAFWLRAGRHDADLAAEIEHHRARTQAALEAGGLTAVEAVARSRRAMGNVTLAREDARAVWIGGALEGVWRDVKYGIRGLRREPAFALTACLTLAMGMAVATTAFSVVDAELWKPLPFPDPDRLVDVSLRAPGPRGGFERIAGADLLDWQGQNRAFTDLAGQDDIKRAVLRRDSSESIMVMPVTASYFSLLGRPPLIGRALAAGDERGIRAGMLSERGWRRLFDGDPAVLGRTVTIDDQPVAIIGVQDGPLQFTQDPDLFLPIDPASPAFRDRSVRTLVVIGRLRPGVDAAIAKTEMDAIAARIARDYPDGRTGRTVMVGDLRTGNTGFNWRPLYFFLWASGLVLLLTCVNVAGLVIARALRRGREFALRGALGGGRGALVRQLLVEGALLAIPGGALGLLFTSWALGALSRFIPVDFLIRGDRIPIDARVSLAAFAVTAVTAVVFGLVPALFARRLNLNVTLGQGGRTTGASPAQARVRHLLLAAQVALTVVLVAAAGIFLRSFTGLTRVPLGFEPRASVALRVSLTGPRYASETQMRGYAASLLERARATPGVQDAAIGTSSPLGSGPLIYFVLPDRPRPAAGDELRGILRSVSPDYFRALTIPLLSGRGFTAADADGAPRVTIVNEVVARRLFPGEDPIGRAVELISGARTPWTRHPGRLTIVGVAKQVKEVGLNEVEINSLYVPFAQMSAPVFDLIARSGAAAGTVAAPLRAAAAAIDPRVPISSVSTFEGRVDNALREDRFNLLLVAGFAVAALLLASLGIFGAIAYAVQERRREFGIRLALGARGRAIVFAAVSRAMRAAGVGGICGLAATLLLARIIGNGLYLVSGDHEGLLYGVTTTDPLALGGALITLLAVATLAAIVPARQATRVDPLVALRSE